MKKTIIAIICVAAFVPTSGKTQQPAPRPPEYVPFTVPKDDYDGLVKFLQKQPWEVAQPLLQWLTQSEAQAQATKAAQDKAVQDKAAQQEPKKDQ